MIQLKATLNFILVLYLKSCVIYTTPQCMPFHNYEHTAVATRTLLRYFEPAHKTNIYLSRISTG